MPIVKSMPTKYISDRPGLRVTKIGEKFYEFFRKSDVWQANVLYGIAFNTVTADTRWDVQTGFETMMKQAGIEYYDINV